MGKRMQFNDHIIEGDITRVKTVYKKRVIWAIIDTEDLPRLIDFRHHWHARWSKHGKAFYLQCNTRKGNERKMIVLSRFLLNYNDGKLKVDHIDHDTLNNRKKNLRLSENKQNTKHRTRRNSNNKSGYRNVSWIEGWYRIQLQINGKNTRLPEKFDDVHKAGKFAEKMRKKYYGEYAGKN
jgi:hypothetical protein